MLPSNCFSQFTSKNQDAHGIMFLWLQFWAITANMPASEDRELGHPVATFFLPDHLWLTP